MIHLAKTLLDVFSLKVIVLMMRSKCHFINDYISQFLLIEKKKRKRKKKKRLYTEFLYFESMFLALLGFMLLPSLQSQLLLVFSFNPSCTGKFFALL